MSKGLELIEKEIPKLEIDEQKRLLRDLPRLLRIPVDDILLLKAAEKSFVFWDNSEDSIYDNL